MSTPSHAGDEQHAAGKRMTLSHVLELLLQRGPISGSGVSLSRNAKGETQIDVVVKVDGAAGVTSPELALEKASALYDLARRRYPLSTGYVGAETNAEHVESGS